MNRTDPEMLDSLIQSLEPDDLRRLREALDSEVERATTRTLIETRMAFGLEVEPEDGFIDEMLSELGRMRRAEPSRLPLWRSREWVQTSVLGAVTGGLALFGTGSWSMNPWWATLALITLFGLGAGTFSNSRVTRSIG